MIGENTPNPAGYPFFESFENALTNWLNAGWTTSTNYSYAGANSARNTAGPRMTPETVQWLVLNQELSLSNAVSPQLTFWLRGKLESYSNFRVQVSTDGGLNWGDLSAFNLDYGFNSDWVRKQASLQSYTNRTLRLRFQINSYWGSAPYTDICLDQIGIGEPAPGAPTLDAPANLASVTIVRPTLSVTNAVDFQGDPLSYRFEVYADAALSNLVAQVPLVASGAAVSSWQVDTDLPNNAQYWWRCQASDGTNTGPWMTTATFFVNEINHPPFDAGGGRTAPGTLVTNLDALLLWFPSGGDPDEGDRVAAYHIQVAADPAFTTNVINATNIAAVAVPPGGNWALTLPLSALPGADNLVPGTLYHWRVSAQDLRGLSSDWSPGANTFQFGIAPPRPATLTGLRPGANGTMTLEWEGAAGELYVEFSLLLNPANWQTIAGPLRGTNWTFTPMPGARSGFYRVRSQ